MCINARNRPQRLLLPAPTTVSGIRYYVLPQIDLFRMYGSSFLLLRLQVYLYFYLSYDFLIVCCQHFSVYKASTLHIFCSVFVATISGALLAAVIAHWLRQGSSTSTQPAARDELQGSAAQATTPFSVSAAATNEPIENLEPAPETETEAEAEVVAAPVNGPVPLGFAAGDAPTPPVSSPPAPPSPAPSLPYCFHSRYNSIVSFLSLEFFSILFCLFNSIIFFNLQYILLFYLEYLLIS